MEAGEPVTVEVPETVDEGDGVRYTFVEWGDGETPFSPINVIAPLAPLTLEPTWVKEYLVTVEGPEGFAVQGSGWYAEGASVVHQAPDVIESETAGEREKFVSWDIVGPPAVTLEDSTVARATVPATAPFTATATYDTELFVLAQAPYGTLQRGWLKDGDPLLLEALPVQDLIPEQRRIVFRRWEGQEGLTSPNISGTIIAPTTLVAVYDVQVMVIVVAPHGATGGGWHKVGSTVNIAVPESAQSHLIFKQSFAGFGGSVEVSGRQPSFDLFVQEPVVITALYNNGVNTGTLALLLLIPFLAVLLYVANKWAQEWMRRLGSDA